MTSLENRLLCETLDLRAGNVDISTQWSMKKVARKQNRGTKHKTMSRQQTCIIFNPFRMNIATLKPNIFIKIHRAEGLRLRDKLPTYECTYLYTFIKTRGTTLVAKSFSGLQNKYGTHCNYKCFRICVEKYGAVWKRRPPPLRLPGAKKTLQNW